LFSKLLFGPQLPTWALFLELAVAGLIVILAASRLTKLADRLATRLNLGSGWIGLILLATVTSLPEVVTGSTAVAIGNADMALAAIFGSCSFNVVLIVLLNAVMGGGSLLGRAHGSHAVTSSFGLVLMALALLSMTIIDKYAPNLALASTIEWVCCGLIAITYLTAMRMTYRFERGLLPDEPPTSAAGTFVTQDGGAGHGKVVALAAILVTAAWWLTRCGDILSTHEIEALGRPLGATFVGAAFLACATSLPEVATCVAAVRLGNLDLALGNIFGSNMFNIFVIPMLKLVSVGSGQPLLLAGADFHFTQNLITGLLPILLTGIAVGALAYRSRRRLLVRFGADSILLLIVYLLGMGMLIINP
jgi:cation:H+ antiporter